MPFIDFIQNMSQAQSTSLNIWKDIEGKLDYLKNTSKDFKHYLFKVSHESLAMLKGKIRKGPYF